MVYLAELLVVMTYTGSKLSEFVLEICPIHGHKRL